VCARKQLTDTRAVGTEVRRRGEKSSLISRALELALHLQYT